jgi:ABC-type antimicrobial peptide transport system permease subunit
LVLGESFKWVAAGAALGVLLAWGVTRLLGDMLFEISPAEPLSFLAMPLGLMLAALLGSYFPARRAMRADPMVALRCE